MSTGTAPHARRAGLRCAWLRTLVLLLALLVPGGAHAEAYAAPLTAAAGDSGAAAERPDLLDAALRPSAREVRRPVVRLRPASLPGPAPVRAASGRPGPAAVLPPPPSASHALACVVLRC
ncbi:hypothetical protein ACFOOM_09695 [Streptomyces echinoruber]|uniref:hypothetical protein n=1 Tax=Streptomyces echinoruber TaxID=68898 RepID=UPI00167CEA9C|nr:hypothetical protein [Streptomyces echinoruber]